jgi:hypothetical protein
MGLEDSPGANLALISTLGEYSFSGVWSRRRLLAMTAQNFVPQSPLTVILVARACRALPRLIQSARQLDATASLSAALPLLGAGPGLTLVTHQEPAAPPTAAPESVRCHPIGLMPESGTGGSNAVSSGPRGLLRGIKGRSSRHRAGLRALGADAQWPVTLSSVFLLVPEVGGQGPGKDGRRIPPTHWSRSTSTIRAAWMRGFGGSTPILHAPSELPTRAR